MALSFEAVKEAYKVCHELELETVPSFLEDFRWVPEWEKKRPNESQLYGVDQKSDSGWEELFFFIKNPSPEFIQKWDELKKRVPNSNFQKSYEEEYTIFGWF